MSFRSFVDTLDREGSLIKIKKEVSTDYEIPNILNSVNETPTIFEKVSGSEMPIVGGLVSSRKLIAKALNIHESQIIHKMHKAIKYPCDPNVVKSGECQEVIENSVDLSKLPIIKYKEKDGGKYIPSAIAIVRDPETGLNVCFHRLMVLGKDRFVARIVENRGTDTALKKAGGELDVAICIGNSIPVLLSASTSLPMGTSEFGMANALEEMELVKCRSIDVDVPKDCEIVLEGKILKETTSEGPFLDLSETYDKIRQQHIIEINKITHRKNPIYQTLNPGGREHKILMGMPKEPTIFYEVEKVCVCKDVFMTDGGSNWFHAVVQIIKRNNDDGRKAIEAAFKGHKSLKHCVVVNDDIDIRNPKEVEWAIATRVQADKDVMIFPNQPGSSLDPSGDLTEGKKATTCKAGIDATIPLEKRDKNFQKEFYKKMDLKNILTKGDVKKVIE